MFFKIKKKVKKCGLKHNAIVGSKIWRKMAKVVKHKTNLPCKIIT